MIFEIKASTKSIFLQGITAFVTGGASGLGRGTVERFVKQGAKVVIADLQVSKGKALANELGEANAIFASVDVCTFYSSYILCCVIFFCCKSYIFS